MTKLQIFSLVCVLVPLVVAAVRLLRRRPEKPVLHSITIQGIGRVSWLAHDDDVVDSAEIARKLVDVLLYVWPEYQRIYDAPQITYRCEDVRLNPRFHKVAQYKAAGRLMTLNPNLNYARGFGAELHNMFRADLFGINRIYSTEGVVDADRYSRAQEIWKAL